MSPGFDHGYDISNFTAVDPIFGTMNDLSRLIREAKKLGILEILSISYTRLESHIIVIKYIYNIGHFYLLYNLPFKCSVLTD